MIARTAAAPGIAVALVVAATAIAAWPPCAEARSKRLRPPPDVTVDRDRGMTFRRLSKTTHDQRLFKPLNQATRLPRMDSAIDPYDIVSHSGTYEPQTGVIRGSLSDKMRDLRRVQDASRRPGALRAEQPRKMADPSRARAGRDPAPRTD